MVKVARWGLGAARGMGKFGALPVCAAAGIAAMCRAEKSLLVG